MDQLRAEFHETVVQLNRKFNRYMRNQSHQIERQQDELNHQCGVIEELAWQIRDLRDSLRKCNDQISRLQSKYCVECAKNHMKLNIPAANRAHPTSEHVAVTSPVYETINFDRDSYNKRNKLKRQDAIDDRIRNPSYCRDVKAFLERCIPPPPSEAPPSDDDDDETYALSPLEFSSETLEKLNSLYSLYKGGRPISSKVDDETADVEYRLPKFNACSTRSLRGSTRAVCSLVSNFGEEPLAISECDSVKSLNKSAEKIASNSTDHEVGCQTEQNRTQNDSTQNDEVYI